MQSSLLLLAALTGLAAPAPQFPRPEQNAVVTDLCRTELVTVFEVSEAVDKVICETEFRESCAVTSYESECRDSDAAGACRLEDNMVCVDSTTSKCGLEQVLKSETVMTTECEKKLKKICEYEWVGEGKTRQWVPVEDSCVTKPVEECVELPEVRENFVEEEVCRDIPIKDCRNVPKEVCDQVCKEVPVEECEIVPHEECRQIKKEAKKVSKQIPKVICDEESVTEFLASENETEATTEDIEYVDIATEFSENQTGGNEDTTTEQQTETTEQQTESETETTTIAFEAATTSPTIVTVADTRTDTTTSSSTTERSGETRQVEQETEDEPEEVTVAGRVASSSRPALLPRQAGDNSRIVFSDDDLTERNNQLGRGVERVDQDLLTRSGSIATTARSRENEENSKIFFPA